MKFHINAFMLLFFQTVFAQYDARQLVALYEQSSRAEILLNQLLAEKSVNTLLPFNEKAKIFFEKNKDLFNACMDSIVLNLPEDDLFKKSFVRLNNKRNLLDSFLNRDQLNKKEWKEFYSVYDSFQKDLQKLKELALLYLTPNQDVLNALNHLEQANSYVSQVFTKVSLDKKLGRSSWISVDKLDGIKSASQKINKLGKFFKSDKAAMQLVTRLKSDLNSMYMGLKNDYSVQLLFSTYERFNEKILKLHRIIFKQNNFIY